MLPPFLILVVEKPVQSVDFLLMPTFDFDRAPFGRTGLRSIHILNPLFPHVNFRQLKKKNAT